MIEVSVCQLTGLCIPRVLPNVGADIAKGAANTFLSVVTSSLALAASYLIDHLVALVNLPSPDLSSGWFAGADGQMERVVELVVAPVLMVASLGAIVKQDFRRLGRIWAVGLPVAVLAGFAGPALATLGLNATDQMSALITPGNSGALSDQLGGAVTAIGSSSAPLFVQMIVLVLMIAGAILIWLELLVRSSAIYLSVFFMPMALVTYIWPTTAHLAKRMVEIISALILSKFVIVGSLALGQDALRGQRSLDGAVTGSAILIIAAFAPFCLMRLAPIVEGAAIAHLEGMSRRPLQATSRASMLAGATVVPAARSILAMAARTPDGAGVGPAGAAGSGGSAGSASSPASSGLIPVAAQPLPERPPDYPVPGGWNGRDG